ncbi:GtrA family protein [Patescibacteria group bacterium]|nr:GtrA family protein [Patescibacteria group bacterium]
MFRLFKIKSQWLGLFNQLIKFGLVGLSNALVDFGLYWLLTRTLSFGQQQYLLMNAVAFLVANLNSFIWNRYWTFSTGGNFFNFKGYGRFLSLSLIYLVFIEIGLWWLVAKVGWWDLLAKAVLLAVGTLFYFTAAKSWVFKESKIKNQKS